MKKTIIAIMVTAMLFLSSCLTTTGSDSGNTTNITLKAADSTLQTTGNLILEDGGNVGYWEATDDIISWEVDIPSDGVYNITLKVSCDPEFPGSILSVTVGDKMVEVEVLDSGAWSDYKILDAGSVNLKKGIQTLKVQAISIANRFVGNLQYVKLAK